MSKKESVTDMRIPNGFQEIFLLRFDIISVLCKHTTLRFVTSGSENGCGK